MSEFNAENWQDALSKVFTRSVTDEAFRQLCLTDPRAAVADVSEIELPAALKFGFVDNRGDVFYSILLPPTLNEGVMTPEQIKSFVDWDVYCTHTDTGTG